MSVFLPDPVIKRLPMYYRYFRKLEAEGVFFISSKEIGELTGLTASQVRQDVNAFGGEGRQGCGYSVAELRHHLGQLLGLNKTQTMMIVGAGNLGRAILRAESFRKNHFVTIAAFDNDPHRIGSTIENLLIQDVSEIESFLQTQKVDIAILTLPANCAQKTAEELYQYGVRGFWNFAPVDLHLPQDAAVVNVHLDESLELLSYRLAHPDEW